MAIKSSLVQLDHDLTPPWTVVDFIIGSFQDARRSSSAISVVLDAGLLRSVK